MADLKGSPRTTIPSIEANADPVVFRETPAAAISAAVVANATVKIVLPGAQDALIARGDKFTQDVGVKAVELAGRRSASAVDVPDIAQAAEELYSREAGKDSFAWGVLGILAGAVLSFLITILVPAMPKGWLPGAIVIAVMMLLGCVFWAFKLAGSKKQR